jgi:hypothetical protein
MYRLQLEAKNKENKLKDNFEQLQKNFPRLLINSCSCRHQKFSLFIDKIVDKISDRAANGIDHLFERIFQKKK